MSGIVGSRLNNRGSGLIGSLGTDGQVLTSSGAGVGAVYEAAAGGMSVSDITGATELAAIPDNTDELVLSDGGTLKRIDYINLAPFGSLGGSFTKGAQNDLTDSTWNKLLLDATTFNRGLTFGSSTITIPSGGDGDYFCSLLVDFATSKYAGLGSGSIAIYKNGGGIEYTVYDVRKAADDYNSRSCHIQWTGVIPALNATDTIEVYVNCIMDQTTTSSRQAEKTRITLFKMNNN